jgi:hypothetical protein
MLPITIMCIFLDDALISPIYYIIQVFTLQCNKLYIILTLKEILVFEPTFHSI